MTTVYSSPGLQWRSVPVRLRYPSILRTRFPARLPSRSRLSYLRDPSGT